jgi:hypothetical protein
VGIGQIRPHQAHAAENYSPNRRLSATAILARPGAAG